MTLTAGEAGTIAASEAKAGNVASRTPKVGDQRRSAAHGGLGAGNGRTSRPLNAAQRRSAPSRRTRERMRRDSTAYDRSGATIAHGAKGGVAD